MRLSYLKKTDKISDIFSVIDFAIINLKSVISDQIDKKIIYCLFFNIQNGDY